MIGFVFSVGTYRHRTQVYLSSHHSVRVAKRLMRSESYDADSCSISFSQFPNFASPLRVWYSEHGSPEQRRLRYWW